MVNPVAVENDAMTKGPRILVAEDIWLTAQELVSTLADIGASVVGPASSLLEAKHLVATETVDCAVLDIDLEGRAAYPVAAELERRSVPIIFVTGYENPHLPPSLRRYPLLKKPFAPERLQELIRQSCMV
jgi:DNA-binding LytR/AlgR family response regulator